MGGWSADAEKAVLAEAGRASAFVACFGRLLLWKTVIQWSRENYSVVVAQALRGAWQKQGRSRI
jgi:hypothetical protein